MRPLSAPPRRQRGLSLVELLVAVTIGLLILATVIGVFFATNRNYRENDALTSLQDNARFAMDTLSRDLAMAGYWGGVRPVDAGRNVRVSAAAIAALGTGTPGDCGPTTPTAGSWLLNPAPAIEFRDHTASTTTGSFSRCLGSLQPNTDVVMIRRAAGQPARRLTAAGGFTLPAGRIYLKSNQSTGSLFRAGGGSLDLLNPTDCSDPDSGVAITCPPVEIPVDFYAYTPHLYFIHNVSGSVTVPTLCRYALRDDQAGAAPAMEEDCLAEGVENLQLEWGIAGTDGRTIQHYQNNYSPDARTVRIHLLARARDAGATPTDAGRQFELANYNSANDTGFAQSGVLRRAFTTTVQLKNYRE